MSVAKVKRDLKKKVWGSCDFQINIHHNTGFFFFPWHENNVYFKISTPENAAAKKTLKGYNFVMINFF